MVRAGLRATAELARLAVSESGFGVFEDKVIKNFVATEFLNDYLKNKKSVGVIDSDPANGLEYIAEPIGVIVAVTPDHQSDVDHPVQGDLCGQDPQCDPVPTPPAGHPKRRCAPSRF